jgi:hypothetical protein
VITIVNSKVCYGRSIIRKVERTTYVYRIYFKHRFLIILKAYYVNIALELWTECTLIQGPMAGSCDDDNKLSCRVKE